MLESWAKHKLQEELSRPGSIWKHCQTRNITLNPLSSSSTLSCTGSSRCLKCLAAVQYLCSLLPDKVWPISIKTCVLCLASHSVRPLPSPAGYALKSVNPPVSSSEERLLTQNIDWFLFPQVLLDWPFQFLFHVPAVAVLQIPHISDDI